MYQNELYHHGVKGMKWGVRRYQNADGTLTAAGEKRYAGAAGNVRLKRDNDKIAYKEYSRVWDNNDKYVRSHPSVHIPNSEHHKILKERYKEQGALADKSYKLHKEYKQAKKEYHQTDEYKAKRNKAIKTGVAVAGTALAVYGGYKAGKAIKSYSNSKAYERATKYVSAQTRKEAAGVDAWAAQVKNNRAVSSYQKTNFGSYHYDKNRGYGYERNNMNYQDMVKLGKQLKRKRR